MVADAQRSGRNKVWVNCLGPTLAAILCLPIFVGTARAQEPETALDSLLWRISHAATEVEYSGIQERETIHAGRPMVFRWRIAHWRPDTTYLEFTDPEPLRGTVYYKEGDRVWCKGDPHVARSLRFAGVHDLVHDGQLLQEIGLLRQNYDLHVERDLRLLNRDALRLRISPRHAARAGFEANIDAATGVLLGSRAVPTGDSIGTVSAAIRFVEFKEGREDRNRFNLKFTDAEDCGRKRKRRIGARYEDIAELLTASTDPVLLPQTVPTGFQLKKIRTFERHKRRFVHLTYTDGLTGISFFQHAGGKPTDGRRRKGRDKSQLHVVTGVKDDIRYTIVGDIPVSELQSMAASLIPVSQNSSEPAGVWPWLLAAVLAGGLFLTFGAIRRRRESHDV